MQEEGEKPHIMKKFPGARIKRANLALILGAILIVLAGVGSGFLLSGGLSATTKSPDKSAPGVEEQANEAGIADESTFSDTAEGTLVKGGIQGEGTHHVDRGLGEEKNVYLTSTVIDLESYVGKKVQVWGETISARHAGWLMDVGKIKVLE
jgi:hypothetical protein